MPTTKSECCGGSGSGHGHHHHHKAGAGVVDPVCGMTVDPETSKHHIDYRGTTYHLCSADCRTKFEAAPQQYIPTLDNEGALANAEREAGRSFGRKATIIVCDLTDRTELRRQIATLSCLDIVVNNAGTAFRTNPRDYRREPRYHDQS